MGFFASRSAQVGTLLRIADSGTLRTMGTSNLTGNLLQMIMNRKSILSQMDKNAAKLSNLCIKRRGKTGTITSKNEKEPFKYYILSMYPKFLGYGQITTTAVMINRVSAYFSDLGLNLN